MLWNVCYLVTICVNGSIRYNYPYMFRNQPVQCSIQCSIQSNSDHSMIRAGLTVGPIGPRPGAPRFWGAPNYLGPQIFVEAFHQLSVVCLAAWNVVVLDIILGPLDLHVTNSQFTNINYILRPQVPIKYPSRFRCIVGSAGLTMRQARQMPRAPTKRGHHKKKSTKNIKGKCMCCNSIYQLYVTVYFGYL